jgi:hypothetical protein
MFDANPKAPSSSGLSGRPHTNMRTTEGGGGLEGGKEEDSDAYMYICVRECFLFCESENEINGSLTSLPPPLPPSLPPSPGRGGKYYFQDDTVQKQLRLFWNMAVPYFKVGKGR